MTLQFPALLKVRNWLRYFYRVPWCVPPWTWREFLATFECILKGRIVYGPCPSKAAAAIKDYLGVRYVLPVNRGRTAIELALRAMQIGDDDDVVMPSYICSSVLDGVLRAGANPVFADVGPDLNVTAESVRAAITPKTRCVIVAHLFGKAAPVDEIETMLSRAGITLIDDAAQAFGARRSARLVGTFGACGVISCGPGKPLVGAAGGFLVTDNEELYKRASAIRLEQESATVIARRLLSFWIWRRFRRFSLPFRVLLDRLLGPEKELPHVNSAMSNLDAAIALKQIEALHKNILRRSLNARILLRCIGPLVFHHISDMSPSGSIVKLVLVLPKDYLTADEFIFLLSQAGIEAQKGYIPCHLADKKSGVSLKNTEALCDRVVCIPVDIKLNDTEKLLRLMNSKFHHAKTEMCFS